MTYKKKCEFLMMFLSYGFKKGLPAVEVSTATFGKPEIGKGKVK